MFFFRSPDNNLVPFTSPLTVNLYDSATSNSLIGEILCGDRVVWRRKFINIDRNDASIKIDALRDFAAKFVEKILEKHEPGAIIDLKKVEGFYL